MARPEVPIQVDPETGVWTTDAMPMLYVPRHFLVANHLAVEEALGRKAYTELLYAAGYRSARAWCAREAETHGLTGMAVFFHYMHRLSQRGWGQFDGREIDPLSGCGRLSVHHSCFVLQLGAQRRGKLCFMFAGWAPGALSWVGDNLGRQMQVHAEETRCAGEGDPVCIFDLRPMKAERPGTGVQL